jgi:hypothetical protein
MMHSNKQLFPAEKYIPFSTPTNAKVIAGGWGGYGDWDDLDEDAWLARKAKKTEGKATKAERKVERKAIRQSIALSDVQEAMLLEFGLTTEDVQLILTLEPSLFGRCVNFTKVYDTASQSDYLKIQGELQDRLNAFFAMHQVLETSESQKVTENKKE